MTSTSDIGWPRSLSLVRGLPASFGTERFVYDVSSFAGENAELRFIWDVDTSYRAIDDILFLVPEPSPFSLIGVGSVILIAWRSRKRHRHREP